MERVTGILRFLQAGYSLWEPELWRWSYHGYPLLPFKLSQQRCCARIEYFFSFKMSGLHEILQVQGLDKNFHKSRDGRLGGFGVG